MTKKSEGLPLDVTVFDTAPQKVVDMVVPYVNPVVPEVIREIDRAADAEYVQVTVSKVTPKIGAKARDIIYTAGIWLGVVGTIAPVIAGALTGEWQTMVASVGAIALSLTNLLAKLNLSKTAADIEKEAA